MKIRFSPKFTIRHLLIAVALFAVLFSWVAYEWNIVQQRKQLRRDLGPYVFNTSQIYPSCYDAEDKPVPWVRKMLGDRSFGRFYFPTSISDEVLERVDKLVGRTIVWGDERRHMVPTTKNGPHSTMMERET
jgi:hypothetical protein